MAQPLLEGSSSSSDGRGRQEEGEKLIVPCWEFDLHQWGAWSSQEGRRERHKARGKWVIGLRAPRPQTAPSNSTHAPSPALRHGDTGRTTTLNQRGPKSLSTKGDLTRHKLQETDHHSYLPGTGLSSPHLSLQNSNCDAGQGAEARLSCRCPVSDGFPWLVAWIPHRISPHKTCFLAKYYRWRTCKVQWNGLFYGFKPSSLKTSCSAVTAQACSLQKHQRKCLSVSAFVSVLVQPTVPPDLAQIPKQPLRRHCSAHTALPPHSLLASQTSPAIRTQLAQGFKGFSLAKPFPAGQGEQSRAGSHCLTSESLTRPSRKEQSAALWVQMWRYLHQWQGKEPFTQDRQLQRAERAALVKYSKGHHSWVSAPWQPVLHLPRG